MLEKLDALYKNKTWTLVPRPMNKNIIGAKWVFRTKFKKDGNIDRYTARLVAKGYSQVEGLYFDETFSHVLKPTTNGLILSLAITLIGKYDKWMQKMPSCM